MKSNTQAVILGLIVIFLPHKTLYAHESNWLISTTIGTSFTRHSTEIGEAIKQIEDSPQTKHNNILINPIAFYYREKRSPVLLGARFSTTIDRYSLDHESFTIIDYSYAFSAIRFLKRLTSGPYVRGDLGLMRRTAIATRNGYRILENTLDEFPIPSIDLSAALGYSHALHKGYNGVAELQTRLVSSMDFNTVSLGLNFGVHY